MTLITDAELIVEQSLFPHLNALTPPPPAPWDGTPLTRAQIPGLGSTQAVTRSDRLVPHGDVSIPVRLHTPAGLKGLSPAVFSIHGGGYIMGSQEMDDHVFESIAPALGCVGVSLDYRLAPEDQYPAAIDDCDAVLTWIYEHGADNGIDVDRLVVLGSSAGGGLAASLALRRGQTGRPFATGLVLSAPMLDDLQSTPSSQLDGLKIWPKENNAFGWRSYLGEHYLDVSPPTDAVPGRATDLSGFPPTFISVGGADGFRDENLQFATRLAQTGIAVDFRMYAGAPHGYGFFADYHVTQQSERDSLEWMARILGVEIAAGEGTRATSRALWDWLQQALSQQTGSEQSE